MQCPYFNQMHDVGVCNASKHTLIPSINKMEHFCFKEQFTTCAFFKNNVSEEQGKEHGQVIPEKRIYSS